MTGEVLKKRREDLGLDLKQISELLKIRHEYLVSIENDCFDKLPVAVYTVGYIRCYAAYLQIDPEPIISLYTVNLSQPKSAAIMPVASSKKRVPVYVYVVSALLILVALLAVFMLRQPSSISGQGAGADPKRYVGTESPQPPKQQELPVAPHVQAPQISTGVSSSSRTDRKDPEEHKITILAKDLTWMHLEFSGGKHEEVLFRPGMSRDWKFSGRVVLKVGNAGGITLNFDGREIGTPGSPGQVMTLVFPEGSSGSIQTR